MPTWPPKFDLVLRDTPVAVDMLRFLFTGDPLGLEVLLGLLDGEPLLNGLFESEDY